MNVYCIVPALLCPMFIVHCAIQMIQWSWSICICVMVITYGLFESDHLIRASFNLHSTLIAWYQQDSIYIADQCCICCHILVTVECAVGYLCKDMQKICIDHIKRYKIRFAIEHPCSTIWMISSALSRIWICYIIQCNRVSIELNGRCKQHEWNKRSSWKLIDSLLWTDSDRFIVRCSSVIDELFNISLVTTLSFGQSLSQASLVAACVELPIWHHHLKPWRRFDSFARLLLCAQRRMTYQLVMISQLFNKPLLQVLHIKLNLSTPSHWTSLS